MGDRGESLRELEVLALDCQAGGSTPAYGDMLELGWAACTGEGLTGTVRSRWIVPRTDRKISWAVRELTGWSEACVAEAIDERAAWAELRAETARMEAGRAAPGGVPTVIHFARFELVFLRDVCERLDGGARLPLDVVCLHAIASRLFPDLPRRNIRALAGYLGHSPANGRRAAGHVEATVFIWSALLPLLERIGIGTWSALKAWLEERAPAARPRHARRVYPLAAERRAALPDRPGVYRFLRRNGDVLYVGKATSLKKRVAGHFKARGPVTERGLELLTQVHDVSPIETPSLLEAALLESDEIKRLDPPYNVQLRLQGARVQAALRSAWFASNDLRRAAPAPDDRHRIGPLPSEYALEPLAALIALGDGAFPTHGLCAAALAVPTVFLPERALFDEGFRIFRAEHLRAEHLRAEHLREEHLAHPPGDDGAEPTTAARLARASRALWLLRGRADAEPDDDPENSRPDQWDLARVRRRLERSLVQTGLLVRRARFLSLLADATVGFREPETTGARALVISAGQIRDRHDLDAATAIARRPAGSPRARLDRQACFDATVYDRLRVLLTELHRVRSEGGDVALRIGHHVFGPEHVARLMRVL